MSFSPFIRRRADSSSPPHQIRAAAAVGGLTLDEPTGYVHYTTNRTPEFTAKFASGKVPAFEDKDGFCLFEGTAIARYGECVIPFLSYFHHKMRIHES